MRIVYMGTPEFAVPSLHLLRTNEYEIVGVVTAPDKPQGRGQRMTPSPVKQYALQHHLPLYQPERLRDAEFQTALASLQPDLIVVAAFRILPKEVFLIPRLGSINLHASLLPKYRGAAPIHWAIINGEKETGVTTFFLQEKVDTGSIILQARVAIGPDTTAGELHDTLSEVGAEIVLQTVRLIERGKVITRPQDETLATPAPKIFKEDCRIRWDRPPQDVHNFIRGLSPLPCAWTKHNGKTVRIYRSSLATLTLNEEFPPGTVARVESDRLEVSVRGGTISLREVQLEGRKRMGIEEFLRGYQLNVGDIFR
jgi:methionyl-tRNA formyltransferase